MKASAACQYVAFPHSNVPAFPRPKPSGEHLSTLSYCHLAPRLLASRVNLLLLWNKMPSRLATSLCGIPLKNPVLAASGTYAYGVELADLVDLAALGGIVVKGLSREPMDGNPPPRVWETEAGMINSIGLQNIGVRAFVKEKLSALRAAGITIFANVFGYAVEDYVEVVRVLEDAEGVAAYELNVSCPHTKHGGIFFSSDPALLSEVVGGVRRVAHRPL